MRNFISRSIKNYVILLIKKALINLNEHDDL